MTARYAIVGAGGLGGPVAYALAAAGAESLTLCDPDRVELSNLQRQVQYSTHDIGRLKVEALADELERRGYPRTRVRTAPPQVMRDSRAVYAYYMRRNTEPIGCQGPIRAMAHANGWRA